MHAFFSALGRKGAAPSACAARGAVPMYAGGRSSKAVPSQSPKLYASTTNGCGDRSFASTPPAAAAAAAAPAKKSLQFDNVATAFAGVPTYSLVRSACVFTVCRWGWVVDNADKILDTVRSVFGDKVVSLMVRPTFFNHFCAGEDEVSIVPTIKYLQANGIGAILDYAAEADVAEEGGDDDDASSPPIAEADPDPAPAELEVREHSAYGISAHVHEARKKRAVDDRVGVTQARVYDYTTELQCDENAKIFYNAIRAVHNVTPTGFAAIKVTALGNPVLLERWSSVLREIRTLFDEFDADGDGTITYDEFANASRKLFRSDVTEEAMLKKQFAKLDRDGAGSVDVTAWVTAFEPRHTEMIADRWLEGSSTPLARAAMTAEEVELIEATIKRAEAVIELADDLDVQVMVDAEHTYFQPAIDNIVLHLQRKFNKGDKATVYNTFQCYLVETPTKLAEHILRSEKEGWNFACKIVRGAYMVLERERADRLEYPDPIQPTLEATHACFNAAVKTVMERKEVQGGASKGKKPVNLLVASHNQESVERAVSLMQANTIDRTTGGVAFGQLLGMSDHLSFTLGNAGYQAYKYVPYGPEHEVLPYLVRRAQENSSMLSGAGVERSLILSELARRFQAFKGNAKP